jgi:hypothetical protein
VGNRQHVVVHTWNPDLINSARARIHGYLSKALPAVILWLWKRSLRRDRHQRAADAGAPWWIELAGARQV